MIHGRAGHRRTHGHRAARHVSPGRGGERRHRHSGALLRQVAEHLRRLPAVQRRDRGPRQPGGRLRDPCRRRPGRAHRIRRGRRGAAHRARSAALRPPSGLPDLREGRRLPAAGVLLPLRGRAHELRGREEVPCNRRREPPDRARPEQVHPVRQVRARLPGGPGLQLRRLRRPGVRDDRDLVVRPPARLRLLPLLRTVRRSVPDGRSRQQAAQGDPQLGPPQGAHHLPVLRRGLQLRPERPQGQGRGRHGQLRRARQRRRAVREGPLSHRPDRQSRAHNDAADQARRRLRAGELGRSARPGRLAGSSRSSTATGPTPSPCCPPRAAPTKRTTCCNGSRARDSTPTASITAHAPDTRRRWPVWPPRWVRAR